MIDGLFAVVDAFIDAFNGLSSAAVGGVTDILDAVQLSANSALGSS